MSPTLERLRNEALTLPEEERRELADSLYESVEQDGASLELTTEWTTELSRRSQDLRTGKVQGIPAEEVFREVDAILNQA